MATKQYNKTKKESGSAGKKSQRIGAIILFSVGLFLVSLAFISGQNIWLQMHNILFGMFGVSAWFLGLLLILFAIFFAMEKTECSIKHKGWQLGLLFFFICAEVQILLHQPYGDSSVFITILNAFADGIDCKGGGVIGALLGVPLEIGLGKTAAAVFLGILILTFVLILTGATLIDFFRSLAAPVKKVEQSARTRQQRLQEKKAQIDIPLDDGLPEHPVSSKKKFFVPDIDEPIKSQKSARNKTKEANAKSSEAPIDDLVKKATKEPEKQDKKAASLKVDLSEGGPYTFPPISLLKEPRRMTGRNVSGELRANADRLVETLRSFGVQTQITDISRGPAVTRYELQPSAGVKISKITNLADDIALNLAAGGVRIEAPIPNKAAVGIEVPNKQKEMVMLREIVESDTFKNAQSKLCFALGKDIAGNIAVADIAKMPHILIAGATGSGKSVCINSLIVSLLYKSTPDEVRFLMIDPKVVELGGYNGIPHLLVPVVTDPRKAAGALGWAVTEMLNRYKLFAATGVRDLEGYNQLAKKTSQISKKASANSSEKDENELNPMPQIVIVIDELADLMMAASKEVEDAICRLAQMARAAGMHLVIATQRPSVDVITGVIKANIPSRIAFTVSSQVDSRTILDSGGAEKLLGKGDMLFSPVGQQKPTRIQGCFVSDKEVESVIEFVKNQENAEYSDTIMKEIERQSEETKKSSDGGGGFEDQDAMLPAAIECVVEAGQASTSFLQRRLKLGYARAARIMDELESRSIVGPQEGSKPREVLMTKQQWMEMNLNREDNIEE